MSNQYLLIPMQMDIMVINQQASTMTSFFRFQMDYSQLESLDPPEPHPFDISKILPQPTAGIYLHWTLPKALRHGSHEENEETEFPLVPNRWLVTRIQTGTAPDQAVKAWILESDYLDLDHGTSPYINPPGTDQAGTPTKIGRVLRFTPDLKGLPVQEKPFLKAIGPGNVHFAMYSPGNDNTFSFYDNLTANDDQTAIDQATFTYLVTGWYSDPTHDPLLKTKWEKSADPQQTDVYQNNKFDWLIRAADASGLPNQSLVHALVSAVPWDRNADNPPPQNYPTDIPNTVKVAIGNTSIDALAALVRLDQNSQREADLLEAFQYGLLEQFDEPGAPERLNAEIRQHWFGASPGGIRWAIVANERDPEATEPPPVISPAQAAALADLNKLQSELDRAQRLLESMQWNLYSLWWKDKRGKPLFIDKWIPGQLKQHLGIGTKAVNPDGNDPDLEFWYIFKVKAQQNLTVQLIAQVKTAVDGFPLDPKTQNLKALNQPQYYYPNDPVLLVSGLGKATNLDPVDGLACRTLKQALSTLTVNGVVYTAAIDPSGKVTVNGIPVPALNDPHHLLPDGLDQIFTETIFLAPNLFAQNILKDPKQADAVRQAIKSLPDPAPDRQYPPVNYARAEWIQPWVPFLLDWEINVLRDPAYSADAGQLTCEFNQERWQFDGADYSWSGSTEPRDFPQDSQMVLAGRTFITPQRSFTLADQIANYIHQHKLRDPALEELFEKLDDYLDGYKNLDILSQRLSGMTAMFIQRNHTQTPALSDDIATVIGDSHSGYPIPFPVKHASYAPAVWDFAPFRGTFFAINRLMVTDIFGRSIDLMFANYSSCPNPKPDGIDPATYFYPVTGRDLTAPTAKNPAPGRGQAANITERLIQLTPRLVQESRLSFAWISNNDQNLPIEETATTNPICGWVIPNHLDRCLGFYAPDGAPWGEIFLSRHAGDQYLPVWRPDPTNPKAPQTVSDIDNIYIRGMLEALLNHPDRLHDLIRTVDEVLWTVSPKGGRQDENLTVLIGRPLAIVRAALSLQFRGLAAYNQDWWNTFIPPQSSPDPKKLPLRAIDGGAVKGIVKGKNTKYFSWPVRLGSAAFRDDGLIGYFLDDPVTAANTFNTFNAINIPAGVQSGYIRLIGPSNYLTLRYIDDTTANPDPLQNQICRLTMLVDPRGAVNAFTGILPVTTLNIPSQLVTPVLQKMAYLFRVGPFLTSPEEIRIPPPAENKGTWSWFDNVLKTVIDISPADGQSRFPVTSPLIKEGWLRFTPDDPESNKKPRP